MLYRFSDQVEVNDYNELRNQTGCPPPTQHTHTITHSSSCFVLVTGTSFILFRTLVWSLLYLLSPFPGPVSLQVLLIFASVALIVGYLVHSMHYLVQSFIISHLVYCSQGLVDLWIPGLPLCQHCNQSQLHQDACIIIGFPVLTLCTDPYFVPRQMWTLASVALDLVLTIKLLLIP